MSDLQLALLGLGAVFIGGVVVYNTVVERKARAKAERAFGSKDHPDVLFDGNKPAPRREPSMSAAPEEARTEPQLGRIDAVARPRDDDAEVEIGQAPGGVDSIVSNRIDTVAVVLADDPVTRETLEPLLNALEAHTTPVIVEGIVEEQWRPIDAGRGSWRELRAGLQLASRSGPVTEEEIGTFNETIAAFAASVGGVSQRESPAAAAQRARDLDRFCADADIEVAVNVVGQFGATFALARVREIGLEHGMSETADGDLVSYARDGTPAYSVRRFDREGDRHDAHYTTGLTFGLDVPHVSDPGAAFDEMVNVANACAATLGGELVDDARKPLSAQGLAAIRRTLEQVFREMESHGIPAGSALARRLFS